MKKHETNTSIFAYNRESLVRFLEQADSICTSCLEILDALEEEDPDDQLDLLAAATPTSMDAVQLYSDGAASLIDSLNYYSRNLTAQLGILIKSIEDIVSSGVYITDEWKDLLSQRAKNVIAGFSYIIWFDFMQDADSDPDDILVTFCDKNFKDLVTFVDLYKKYHETYKLRARIFDDYPELLAPFEEIMGPYLCSVNLENLTITIIQKALQGDFMPEDVIKATKGEEGDI